MRQLNFESLTEEMILEKLEEYMQECYPQLNTVTFINYKSLLTLKEQLNFATIEEFLGFCLATQGELLGSMEFKENFIKSHSSEFLLKLRNAKQGNYIFNELDFKELRHLLGDSIIKISKIMHCINPMEYPLWNGDICYSLTGEKGASIQNYLYNYLLYKNNLDDALKNIKKNSEFNQKKSLIEEKIGFTISPYYIFYLIIKKNP